MLIPKKNRVLIYEYLFKEGVLVAKEDKYMPKHPNIEVPNLEVTKAMEVKIIEVSTCKFFLKYPYDKQTLF